MDSCKEALPLNRTHEQNKALMYQNPGFEVLVNQSPEVESSLEFVITIERFYPHPFSGS